MYLQMAAQTQRQCFRWHANAEMLLCKGVMALKDDWEKISDDLNSVLSPRVKITRRNCKEHFESMITKFRAGERAKIAKWVPYNFFIIQIGLVT